MVLLSSLQKGTELFGLNVRDDNSIVYREWAPNAASASLVGDFSKPYHPNPLFFT